MTKPFSRYLSKNFIAQLQDFLQTPLMSVGYLISAIISLFSGHGFWALMFLVSCAYSNPVLLWRIQNQFRSVLQRFKLNSTMLMGVIFGLSSGVILGLAFVQPAHAQFFNNAQIFVQNTFKGSGLADTAATGIIGLVMNTLRLLFVMYVLFGIVQVFNAVRQGEEWKDLAKTPFFVVLAGTLGDVLVGAIVGSTGATTTPPVTIPSPR